MKRSLASLRAWQERTRTKMLAAPKRRKPLPKVNRKRLAKRRAAQFGDQAALARRLPCCVCAPPHRFWAIVDAALGANWRDWDPICDPHHETHTRGSGRGRDEHVIPMCRSHHIERGGSTRDDFESKHGVDLRRVADAIHSRIKERA